MIRERMIRAERLAKATFVQIILLKSFWRSV